MTLEIIPELQTFLISILPIAGIRISIPFAVTVLDLSWQNAFLISMVGAVFATLIILTFLEWVTDFLKSHFRVFRKIINYIFERTRKEKGRHVKKYGYLALAGFTAIPLPFSGVWTASLVAYLFGLNYKKAFFSIILGAIVSASIVTAVTMTGETIIENGGLKLVGLLLLLVLFYYYLCVNNNDNNKKT